MSDGLKEKGEWTPEKRKKNGGKYTSSSEKEEVAPRSVNGTGPEGLNTERGAKSLGL